MGAEFVLWETPRIIAILKMPQSPVQWVIRLLHVSSITQLLDDVSKICMYFFDQVVKDAPPPRLPGRIFVQKFKSAHKN